MDNIKPTEHAPKVFTLIALFTDVAICIVVIIYCILRTRNDENNKSNYKNESWMISVASGLMAAAVPMFILFFLGKNIDESM